MLCPEDPRTLQCCALWNILIKTDKLTFVPDYTEYSSSLVIKKSRHPYHCTRLKKTLEFELFSHFRFEEEDLDPFCLKVLTKFIHLQKTNTETHRDLHMCAFMCCTIYVFIEMISSTREIVEIEVSIKGNDL